MEETRIIPRPEKLMINRFLGLLAGTAKIIRALRFLAVSWSAVVLLGGFVVHDLPPKEFWLLTALTFVVASRLMETSICFGHENGIIRMLRQQKWIKAHKAIISMLGTMQLVKWIIGACYLCLCLSSPFVSLGVSVSRLVHGRDIAANGAAAKLNAALDIFYALHLLQSLFSLYYIVIYLNGEYMQLLTNRHSGLEEEWDYRQQAVRMYYSETEKKLRKDGKLPCNWDLITYAIGLLQSASGDDDYLWGARVLDKLFDDTDASIRRQLLSSRISIQNLIGMIGRRGAAHDIIESRERAARIVAHLATSINITHFPGIVQCICSLLERSNYCEPQVTTCRPSENPQNRLLPDDKKDQHEKPQHHQDDAYMAVPIKDQTDGHEHQQASLAKRKGIALMVWDFINDCREAWRQVIEFIREACKERTAVFPNEFRGAKELISQGLLILERLTQDEGNCTEISRHQRLVAKITSPLSSHDFLSNARDKKMVGMLNKSLTVVSRLLSSPGDGATRLRQELASKTEAASNLMAILELADSSESAQELHEQALEILAELAFDDSFKKLDFEKLLKALVRIFLEKEASNTAGDMATVDVADSTIAELERADREHKATRLRRKAGEALARLLPLGAATDVKVADKLSKQEAIDLLTKVFDQILSSKMGKTEDAVKRVVIQKKNLVIGTLDQILSSKMGNYTDAAVSAARETKNLVTKEHDQILSSKMGTNADAAKKALTIIESLPTEGLSKLILPSKMEVTVFVASLLRILIHAIEKQSEEIKSMAAMLSLAVVMCNKNAMSREDFARATPGDETMVKKLKEILKVNKHCTAECLEVVKLTCHVVVAMIKAQPSCIQRFNEHNFEETLAETLETMSEVDDCLLFAGNDREVIKPARSLASLVKEAQELLKTT